MRGIGSARWFAVLPTLSDRAWARRLAELLPSVSLAQRHAVLVDFDGAYDGARLDGRTANARLRETGAPDKSSMSDSSQNDAVFARWYDEWNAAHPDWPAHR
jgi:hypothetical protein